MLLQVCFTLSVPWMRQGYGAVQHSTAVYLQVHRYVAEVEEVGEGPVAGAGEEGGEEVTLQASRDERKGLA